MQDNMLQDALRYHMQGAFQEAESTYLELLRLEPENPDANHLLGVLKAQMNDNESAQRFIEKALKAKPDDAVFLGNLGNVQKGLGDSDAAFESYKKALSIQPDFPDAHNNLGTIYLQRGDNENALNCFQHAHRLSPEVGIYWMNVIRTQCTVLPCYSWGKALQHLPEICHLDPFLRKEKIVYKAISSWIEGDVEQCKNKIHAFETLEQGNHKDTFEGHLIHQEQEHRKHIKRFYRYIKALVEFEHPQPELKEDMRKIWLLGDAHTLTFHGQIVKLGNEQFQANSEIIIGCKAWHLAAPNGNSNQSAFCSRIGTLPEDDPVMIVLGEIDTRTTEGIYPHCKKTGENMSENIQFLVQNCLKKVKDCAKTDKILIASTPAPVSASAETLSLDEQQNYIKMVKEYNDTLRSACNEYGYQLVDFYTLTAGPEYLGNEAFYLDDCHLIPSALYAAMQQ